MAPAPGAFTWFENEKLRILEADFTLDRVNVAAGTVRVDGAGELRIATRDGWLVPRVLQRPGKRALQVADFVRGRPIADGTTVG